MLSKTRYAIRSATWVRVFVCFWTFSVKTLRMKLGLTYIILVLVSRWEIYVQSIVCQFPTVQQVNSESRRWWRLRSRRVCRRIPTPITPSSAIRRTGPRRVGWALRTGCPPRIPIAERKEWNTSHAENISESGATVSGGEYIRGTFTRHRQTYTGKLPNTHTMCSLKNTWHKHNHTQTHTEIHTSHKVGVAQDVIGIKLCDTKRCRKNNRLRNGRCHNSQPCA